MPRYKPGDIAFLIESNVLVRKVVVRKYAGGLVLVQNANGGGIKVRENRLFTTQEEAAEKIRSMGRTPRDGDHEVIEKKEPPRNTHVVESDLSKTSSAAAAFSPRYKKQ